MNGRRVVLIGCGVVGKVHLAEALATPGCEVVGVCDLFRSSADAVAAQHGIARVYATPAEALADPNVDGLILALPTAARQELALQALAAGKHLLLEKPMGLCAAEIQALLAAQGNRVVACCSARMSLMTHARVARAAYARGELGELRSIHCWATSALGTRPTSPPPAWRVSHALNGGGILMNWGIYDLDFVLGLSSWTLQPEVVSAHTWGVAAPFGDRVAPGSDAETHLTAMIRFAGGATMVYERGEFTAAAARQEWQLLGTEGALRLHLHEAKAPVWLDRADAASGVQSRVLHEDPTSTEYFMRGPVGDWVASVRETRAPQTGLQQALVLSRLTDAIYRSAQSGRECAV
jgi:predicted dehydrogenase